MNNLRFSATVGQTTVVFCLYACVFVVYVSVSVCVCLNKERILTVSQSPTKESLLNQDWLDIRKRRTENFRTRNRRIDAIFIYERAILTVDGR